MVNFNSLVISEDFKTISIDVSISNAQEYAGFHISKIYVEYYKNRNTLGVPSEKAALAYSNTDPSVREYSGTFSITTMREAEPKLVSFEGGLFYIIVVCESGTGTNVDVLRDVGSVLDWHKVYSLGMQAIMEFNSGCNRGTCFVPDYLEQFVLVWHSLEFAIAAQDVDQVDRLWSRFIAVGSAVGGGSSTCNCG